MHRTLPVPELSLRLRMSRLPRLEEMPFPSSGCWLTAVGGWGAGGELHFQIPESLILPRLRKSVGEHFVAEEGGGALLGKSIGRHDGLSLTFAPKSWNSQQRVRKKDENSSIPPRRMARE